MGEGGLVVGVAGGRGGGVDIFPRFKYIHEPYSNGKIILLCHTTKKSS